MLSKAPRLQATDPAATRRSLIHLFALDRGAASKPASLLSRVCCLQPATIFLLFCSAFAILLLGGCMPMKALRPGTATTSLGGTSTSGNITQSENPAQASNQSIERNTEKSLTLPAGTTIVQDNSSIKNQTNAAPAGRPAESARQVITLAAPSEMHETTSEKTVSTIGAAQKDTARELAAKFADMKPVQWVGIALILAAGAFLYFGWQTPALISAGTGVGMIVLAHSIVGNEKIIIILAIVALMILAVFRAYEKGHHDSLIQHLKGELFPPSKPTVILPTVTTSPSGKSEPK